MWPGVFAAGGSRPGCHKQGGGIAGRIINKVGIVVEADEHFLASERKSPSTHRAKIEGTSCWEMPLEMHG